MDTRRWVHNHLNIDGAEAPVHLTNFKRKNLAKLFYSLEYKCGAEIGIESGKFSQQICNQNPGVELLCVDAWAKYRGYSRALPQEKYDKQEREARQRLAPYDVVIAHDFSMNAVETVEPESLDFVYIDGNHAFDYVMRDIIEWAKRVRRGGIVSGHDYYVGVRSIDVIEAVDVYTKVHGIKEWFLTNEPHAKSWFWVKH